MNEQMNFPRAPGTKLGQGPWSNENLVAGLPASVLMNRPTCYFSLLSLRITNSLPWAAQPLLQGPLYAILIIPRLRTE